MEGQEVAQRNAGVLEAAFGGYLCGAPLFPCISQPGSFTFMSPRCRPPCSSTSKTSASIPRGPPSATKISLMGCSGSPNIAILVPKEPTSKPSLSSSSPTLTPPRSSASCRSSRTYPAAREKHLCQGLVT